MRQDAGVRRGPSARAPAALLGARRPGPRRPASGDGRALGAALRRHAGRLLRSRAGKAVLLGLALSPLLVVHAAAERPTAATVSAPLPADAGADVSYPQCAKPLPTGIRFAVVGLNDGRPGTTNPCLLGPGTTPSGELAWAAGLGGTGEGEALALYVNTDDPGPTHDGKPVPSWPTSGSSPLGPCLAAPESVDGQRLALGFDSQACAWRYGADAASADLTLARSALGRLGRAADVGALEWWLDVETVNSWQHGPSGETLNTEVLEGFVAGLRAAGVAHVGIYSTTPQWQRITGLSGSLGPLPPDLAALPVWLPGAGSASGAAADCASRSFTGGPVLMTQWTVGHVDHDLRCAPVRGATPLGP